MKRTKHERQLYSNKGHLGDQDEAVAWVVVVVVEEEEEVVEEEVAMTLSLLEYCSRRPGSQSTSLVSTVPRVSWTLQVSVCPFVR